MSYDASSLVDAFMLAANTLVRDGGRAEGITALLHDADVDLLTRWASANARYSSAGPGYHLMIKTAVGAVLVLSSPVAKRGFVWLVVPDDLGPTGPRGVVVYVSTSSHVPPRVLAPSIPTAATPAAANPTTDAPVTTIEERMKALRGKRARPRPSLPTIDMINASLRQGVVNMVFDKTLADPFWALLPKPPTSVEAGDTLKALFTDPALGLAVKQALGRGKETNDDED